MLNSARRRNLVSAVAGSLLVLGGIAPAQNVNLELLGTVHPGFRIGGAFTDDRSGYSVSGAGDVNGDGLADLIIGADFADPDEESESGESYVVFGKSTSGAVSLGSLGADGFRIVGVYRSDASGKSVSAAGDVNGDGLADLIVGAYNADPNMQGLAGESYVVFGKTGTTAVSLKFLGENGFRIDGNESDGRSGSSVSGAGDVNGDGLADLIVGAPYSDRTYAAIDVGKTYVVFGKTGTAVVSLGSLGAGGFRIDGIDPNDHAGNSVSGAGDVNGDGLADLIVGANYGDPNGQDRAGESYVVFGRAGGATVSLSNLGNGGFRLDGTDASDKSASSVSGAGDVNGDGLADLIVGAYRADPSGRDSAGESYVVFGKSGSDTINLSNLGAGGFAINGGDASDRSGISVAGAGDVNGDGFADLIVGAYRADPGGREAAGESYVVFGTTGNASVDLSELGADGYRIDGIDASARSGRSVSGAGDVNGDGLADLLVGAFAADSNGLGVEGQNYAGESYVVFSTANPAASASYKSLAAAGNPQRAAIGVTGDGSNDGTPDARVWIDFENGATASTQTIRLIRNTEEPPKFGNSGKVAWEITSDRPAWSGAKLTFKYLDSEVVGLQESEIEVLHAPSELGPWTALPTTVNVANNMARVTVSEFGYFAFVPLPVMGAGWMAY